MTLFDCIFFHFLTFFIKFSACVFSFFDLFYEIFSLRRLLRHKKQSEKLLHRCGGCDTKKEAATTQKNGPWRPQNCNRHT